MSTLEALVAMAILGLALAPLFALSAQLARGASRDGATLAEARDLRDGLAVLREVNPMAEPAGARALGAGRRLVWRASPLTRPTTSLAEAGGPGAFVVALYRVDAEVRAAGSAEPSSRFAVELLGYRPADPEPGAPSGRRTDRALSGPE